MKKYILILFNLSVAFSYSQIQNESFTLTPGETYMLSAWVKDEGSGQPTTYTGKIEVENIYIGGSATIPFIPEGKIIDGWQLITGKFTLHEDTTSITFSLIPNSTNNISYFDDIRVYPFNGNLKSFVYDPVTQRLMAELDENNYATFYEYDNEGGLVRVKKETERGIYTIQETRSGNSKINNQ